LHVVRAFSLAMAKRIFGSMPGGRDKD
jgi:hypothetical protein